VSKYLLTGIGRCSVCCGGLTVRSRQHGKQRSFRYVCATYHYRGKAICNNGLELRREIADSAILSAIEADILRPSVTERAVRRALDALERDGPDQRRAALSRDLARTEGELAHLVAAIAEGGALAPLLDAMRAREQERERLRCELRSLDSVIGLRPRDRRAIEQTYAGTLVIENRRTVIKREDDRRCELREGLVDMAASRHEPTGAVFDVCECSEAIEPRLEDPLGMIEGLADAAARWV